MKTSPYCYWLSRVSPRQDIRYGQLVDELDELDPYGQHQVLWKLFDVVPEERTGRAEFLFRSEKKGKLPVFYVLSRRQPYDHSGLWQIDKKPYKPALMIGDRLAFKLRVNPIVTRKGEANGRSKRHDVVMDAKRQMNWKTIPKDQHPMLADLAQKAGVRWLQARAERLGCRFEEKTLRADGYRTWRQTVGKRIELSMMDLEGTLTVTNPGLLSAALFNGVGPAKGFGCGLLLLRRV